MMDVQKQIDYWREGSDQDWESAKRLVASGHDYHWALFIMHLAMEKALKAHVAKRTEQPPPKIHGLLKLAELAGLTLSTEQTSLLGRATRFNMHVRYPEEQAELYKTATQALAKEYLQSLGEMRQWILNQV